MLGKLLKASTWKGYSTHCRPPLLSPSLAAGLKLSNLSFIVLGTVLTS